MNIKSRLDASNKLKRVYQSKLTRALECLDLILKLSKDDTIKIQIKSALREIRGNIKEEK